MSLKDDLIEIDGVGEKTAEKIVEVVDADSDTAESEEIDRELLDKLLREHRIQEARRLIQ